jgi:protein SCO1/2
VRRLLLLAIVLVAAGCGGPAARVETPPPAKKTFAGGEVKRPAPPLSLKDAHGRRFTLSAMRGRYVLVTFLYTHCPDVCPLIASNLNTVLRRLGPKAKAKVDVLAVSVDPKGDTAPAVRAYEKRMHLDPRFHFLIGNRAALRPVWSAWHVLAVDRKPDLVDHVSYTALVDPAGKQRLLYDSQVNAQQVLNDLRLLTTRT